MGLGGKFQQKSNAWDENRTFLEGDVLEVEYAMAAGCRPTFRPGRAWHRLPAQRHFRMKSDGVTAYVTSSHGAATPLRYDVTGHWLEISQCGRDIADEQADRVGSARRVLVCRLWIARPAISASGRWVLKHLPSEVRFGRFRAKRSIG